MKIKNIILFVMIIIAAVGLCSCKSSGVIEETVPSDCSTGVVFDMSFSEYCNKFNIFYNSEFDTEIDVTGLWNLTIPVQKTIELETGKAITCNTIYLDDGDALISVTLIDKKISSATVNMSLSPKYADTIEDYLTLNYVTVAACTGISRKHFDNIFDWITEETGKSLKNTVYYENGALFSFNAYEDDDSDLSGGIIVSSADDRFVNRLLDSGNVNVLVPAKRGYKVKSVSDAEYELSDEVIEEASQEVLQEVPQEEASQEEVSNDIEAAEPPEASPVIEKEEDEIIYDFLHADFVYLCLTSPGVSEDVTATYAFVLGSITDGYDVNTWKYDEAISRGYVSAEEQESTKAAIDLDMPKYYIEVVGGVLGFPEEYKVGEKILRVVLYYEGENCNTFVLSKNRQIGNLMWERRGYDASLSDEYYADYLLQKELLSDGPAPTEFTAEKVAEDFWYAYCESESLLGEGIQDSYCYIIDSTAKDYNIYWNPLEQALQDGSISATEASSVYDNIAAINRAYYIEVVGSLLNDRPTEDSSSRIMRVIIFYDKHSDRVFETMILSVDSAIVEILNEE